MTQKDMLKLATWMTTIHKEGCWLGDFAREVAKDPAAHDGDQFTADILTTFSETMFALGHKP